MGRLPSRASPAQKRPPCQRGLSPLGDWGIPTGLASPPVNGQPLAHCKGGGLPPSLAPLVRNPFTAVRRGRACPARSLTIESPLTVCFVGSGLDRSAAFRETAVNGISVGEGFIPPVHLPAAAHLRGASGTPSPTAAVREPSAANPAHKQKPLPICNHRQRLSIFQSKLIHTAGTSSSAPRPCWRPRPSCSQSQTHSLQCSRRSPSSRRDPCRGS